MLQPCLKNIFYFFSIFFCKFKTDAVTGAGQWLPADDESSECNAGKALEHGDNKFLSTDDTHNSKPEVSQLICTTSVQESSNISSFHQTDILHQSIPRVTGGQQRAVFCTTHSPGLPVVSSTSSMRVVTEQKPCLNSGMRITEMAFVSN